MQDTSESPVLIEALLFVARCVLPLLIMLGISYLLRRLGLIAEPPSPPPDAPEGRNGSNGNNKTAGGGIAHGKA
jgi:hypothetical protein